MELVTFHVHFRIPADTPPHRFGRPITTMPYFEHVLEADEASRRTAVKLLTHSIETQLVELTINAPDWSVITCHG